VGIHSKFQPGNSTIGRIRSEAILKKGLKTYRSKTKGGKGCSKYRGKSPKAEKKREGKGKGIRKLSINQRASGRESKGGEKGELSEGLMVRKIPERGKD